METRRATHPTADVLKAFGLGKLDDSSTGALLAHLDGCAECRQTVASISGDDFLDRIRQAHSRSGTPAPAKTLGGVEGKPKPPAVPTTLFNLPPELADNPQYDILKELGHGGMGVVYLAKNKLMDRLEVLKVINKTLLDRPGAIERFLREIRSAAKLNHVNVVAAYSALQLGNLLVFAMEYIEGQDLAAVVKAQGPLPVPHACFYVQQAAQGLQHAFEKSMVHRDIKPQNLILAREGRKHIVKVLDFGLAKVMQEKPDDLGLTGEGKMLGTPDYMAPEQTLDATSADIRADIYSLGCTLYFLLSGSRPFKAKTLYDIMQAHQSMEAPAVNVARPEVPAELAAVVRKMMAKDRAKRYQTPLEVVQALKPFLKQVAASKSSPGLSVAGVVPVAKAVSPSLPSAPAKKPLPEAATPVAWDSLTDSVIASGRSRKSGTVGKRPWLIAGGLATVLLVLGLLGYWLATVLLRVETPNGTLLVEMNDDEVEARIKNGKLILSGPDGKIRYTLTATDRSKKLEAGPYKIRVEGADGLVLDTSEFTIKKGGEVKVRVTMGQRDVVKNTPARLYPDRKPDDTGFVSLFNGKDLTGWKTHPDDKAKWQVKDGILIGSGQMGQLFSERGDYENFHFRLEAMINDHGNSGQYFRTEFAPRFPKGYEAQINSTARDPIKTGSLYGIVNITEQLHKPDEWFTQEVIAEGDHILIKVNGKTVVDTHDSRYKRGHFALQQYDPATVVKFRKIEMKIILKNTSASLIPGRPVDAAWLKEVAALPPAEQVQAVGAKLKELNPSFVGPLTPIIGGRIVRGLEIGCNNVEDISPLQALPGLRTLHLGAGLGIGVRTLADLLPLKDLKLTELHLLRLPVTDLTPLKDMKLTTLRLSDMPSVKDLSPLKGMKLTWLEIDNTQVKDLSPLEGMPLTYLNCGPHGGAGSTPVSDLTPLKGMSLKYLNLARTQVSDLSPLKEMKLTFLNCEGTKVTDAGAMLLEEMFSLRRLDLTRMKITDAGLVHLKKLTELEELNIGGTKLTSAGLVHLKGMTRLQILHLGSTELTDVGLTHLEGLRALCVIGLDQTRVTDAGLDHLAGLTNLAHLSLNGTAVTDKGVAKLKAALPRCNIIR